MAGNSSLANVQGSHRFRFARSFFRSHRQIDTICLLCPFFFFQRHWQANGVELVAHETSLRTSDFYNDPAKIRTTYYKEICDTVQRATGAARVIGRFVRHTSWRRV